MGKATSKIRKKPVAIPDYSQMVSIGSNADVCQVAMVFGDPHSPTPAFVAFTPSQAIDIGHALIVEGQKLLGKPS